MKTTDSVKFLVPGIAPQSIKGAFGIEMPCQPVAEENLTRVVVYAENGETVRASFSSNQGRLQTRGSVIANYFCEIFYCLHLEQHGHGNFYSKGLLDLRE